MIRSRKLVVLAMALAMALATFAAPASAAGNETRTYKVTVTNLTGGQPMTPFVIAIHDKQFKLFKSGRAASNGVQQVAENGGVPVLVAELTANPRVASVAVAGSAPVPPGTSEETYIEAAGNAKRLSIAAMLVCTNDGFTGLDSVKLPHNQATFYGRAWDAGTEINTESYTDLVPPCDGLGQTGMTNPALAENGVVHLHQGILGIADLDPAVHGWSGPLIKVTIERVS